jgi:hypothetical protein
VASHAKLLSQVSSDLSLGSVVLKEPMSAVSRVTAIKFLNPKIGSLIGSLNPPSLGVTRDKLTVPVCPVATPSDTVLFEEPADASKKLYMPRYRVVDQPPLQITLAQGAQDWTLTVRLTKFRAPELEQSGSDANELSHSATVLLRHNLFVGGAVAGIKELALDEVTSEAGGLRAVLRGTATAARDQIFLVMTDPSYAASLIVRRVAIVAVPLVTSPAANIVSEGEGVLRGIWFFDFDAGKETSGPLSDVWWEQQTAIQRQLVPQGSASLVGLGVRNFDAITLDDLQRLTYGTAPILGNADGSNQLVPGSVFAVLTHGHNYAKVKVLEYGYNLKLGWVTYQPQIRRRPILFEQKVFLASPHAIGAPEANNATAVAADSPVFIIATDKPPPAAVVATVNTPVSPGVLATDVPLSAGAVVHTAVSPGALTPVDQPLSPVATLHTSPSAGVLGTSVTPISPGVIFQPPDLPPPPPPTLYRTTVFSDDEHMVPDPFVFAPSSYVFVNVGAPGHGFGLERNDVGSDSYYRDLSQPWVYYYLPDSLKLARRDESPHYPVMSVQIAATDDDLAHATVTLAYAAMPFVDPGRLAAATTELTSRLPLSSLPQGVMGAVLEPLQVDSESMKYTLSIPGKDGPTGAQPREHAIVDLRTGIVDALTMTLEDFQFVYGALFSNTELFRGEVQVKLGEGGFQTEHIPLIGRMADSAGAPALDATDQPDPTSGGVSATLTNAIESPLQVDRLDAKLRRGHDVYDANIVGLSLATPARLAPTESLNCVVAPVNPVSPGSGTLTADFDLSGVTVQPDPQSVWQAILDPFTPNQYQHPITLEAYASAFSGTADHPDDKVLQLNVDFKQGHTVELTPSMLPPAADPNTPTKITVSVPLQLAISDYVLNTEQYNAFDYRITTVRPSGSVTSSWVHVAHSDIVTLQ